MRRLTPGEIPPRAEAPVQKNASAQGRHGAGEESQAVIRRVQRRAIQRNGVGHHRQPTGRRQQERLAQPEGGEGVEERGAGVTPERANLILAGGRQAQGRQGEADRQRGRGVGSQRLNLQLDAAQQPGQRQVDSGQSQEPPAVSSGVHAGLIQGDEQGDRRQRRCRVVPERLVKIPGRRQHQQGVEE